MFKKFKQSASQYLEKGKDKVNDLKREYNDKQQGGWRGEVQLENQNFKKVNEWFDQYEKQSGKNKKEESKSQQALQQKMNDVMVSKMADNVMMTMVECLALATEAAANEIEQAEPQIYTILNAITASFLTYRFQYKNKKKFFYLRRLCVDRIALTFVDYVDIEAKKLGQDPLNLEADLAQKIVDKVVDILATEIEKKKQLTLEKFKASPLFNLAALNNGDEIDEIIKMIIDIVQTFGEQKIDMCIGQLRTELPKIFALVIKHQAAIRQNMEYYEKYKENSDEYNEKTREEIIKQMDDSYKTARKFVKTFIRRFSGFLLQSPDDEEDEEQA